MDKFYEKANPLTKKIISTLREMIDGTDFKNKTYLVGGCVRDTLVGVEPHDYDLVVNLPNGGVKLANYLTDKDGSRKLNKNPKIFDGFGTAKFSLASVKELEGIEFESVYTRKESYTRGCRKPSTVYGTLKDDANRRDLTVNALYYNISSGEVWDFTDCQTCIQDLTNGLVRTVKDSETSFEEDPLRILRTIRFASRFGWGIERNTWMGIIKTASLVEELSSERVRDEIEEMLLADKPSESMYRLLRSGVIEKLIPDLGDLDGQMENKSAKVTLFDHTMSVLDEVQPCIESRLAALFHDVGRLLGETTRSKTLNSFSAEIARSDLKDLKFPKDVIESVSIAITHHGDFDIYSDTARPSDKKLRRFIANCGDDYGFALDLMAANNKVRSYNKKPHQVGIVISAIEKMNMTEEIKHPKIPINGHDLMKEFNIKGGRHISIMLDKVKEAFFDNPNITKDDCFKVAQKALAKMTV